MPKLGSFGGGGHRGFGFQTPIPFLPVGEILDTTPGLKTFVIPPYVKTISVLTVGGGGAGGGAGKNSGGGGGGALSYANNIAVIPGETYKYNVGAGGTAGTYLTGGTAGEDSWFNKSSNSTSDGFLVAGGGYAGTQGNQNAVNQWIFYNYTQAGLTAGETAALRHGPTATSSIGTYEVMTWTCPEGIWSINIAAIGAGGAGGNYFTSNGNGFGGQGGSLVYVNDVYVVPGITYEVHFGVAGTKTNTNTNNTSGSGGDSAFFNITGVTVTSIDSSNNITLGFPSTCSVTGTNANWVGGFIVFSASTNNIVVGTRYLIRSVTNNTITIAVGAAGTGYAYSATTLTANASVTNVTAIISTIIAPGGVGGTWTTTNYAGDFIARTAGKAVGFPGTTSGSGIGGLGGQGTASVGVTQTDSYRPAGGGGGAGGWGGNGGNGGWITGSPYIQNTKHGDHFYIGGDAGTSGGGAGGATAVSLRNPEVSVRKTSATNNSIGGTSLTASSDYGFPYLLGNHGISGSGITGTSYLSSVGPVTPPVVFNFTPGYATTAASTGTYAIVGLSALSRVGAGAGGGTGINQGSIVSGTAGVAQTQTAAFSNTSQTSQPVSSTGNYHSTSTAGWNYAITSTSGSPGSGALAATTATRDTAAFGQLVSVAGPSAATTTVTGGTGTRGVSGVNGAWGAGGGGNNMNPNNGGSWSYTYSPYFPITSGTAWGGNAGGGVVRIMVGAKNTRSYPNTSSTDLAVTEGSLTTQVGATFSGGGGGGAGGYTAAGGAGGAGAVITNTGGAGGVGFGTATGRVTNYGGLGGGSYMTTTAGNTSYNVASLSTGGGGAGGAGGRGAYGGGGTGPYGPSSYNKDSITTAAGIAAASAVNATLANNGGSGGYNGGGGGVNGSGYLSIKGGKGGGGGPGGGYGSSGGDGYVRIIWGANRQFPSSNVGALPGDIQGTSVAIMNTANSQRLTVAYASGNSSLYGFGTKNFTIECWVYFPITGDNVTPGGDGSYIFDLRGGFVDNMAPGLKRDSQPFNYNFLTYMTQGYSRITSTNTVSTKTWMHVAIVRNGLTHKMYINGKQSGNTYTEASLVSYVYPSSGNIPTIGESCNGTIGSRIYISNFRIVNDIAIYKNNNFSVPTKILTNDMSQYTTTNGYQGSAGNVSLLALASNTSVTTDSGGNSQTIVNTGSIIKSTTVYATYASGGASGVNTFVITNATGITAGQPVFGTGIPKYTYYSLNGTSITGASTYSSVAVKSTSGTGTGATFNITKTGGLTTYSSSNTTITIVSPGLGYNIGDVITISGASLGGVTVTNDLSFIVKGGVYLIYNYVVGTTTITLVDFDNNAVNLTAQASGTYTFLPVLAPVFNVGGGTATTF